MLKPVVLSAACACAAVLAVLAAGPLWAGGTWTVYTAEGSREEPVPEFTMIEVGEPEVIDYGEGVVTGTGQGTIITVDEEVIPGPGGTPAAGPVIDGWGRPGMAQDKEGNLWLVAPDKRVVSKFDGIGWTVYGLQDGLADRVSGVAVDPQGNVWFSGYRSTSRFDGANWTRYDLATSGAAVACNGDVWFARGYAYRFDGTNWWKYTAEDGLPYETAYLVAPDSAGSVWLGMSCGPSQGYQPVTIFGVTHFDGAVWVSYGYEYEKVKCENCMWGYEHFFCALNSTRFMTVGRDNTLWAATAGGLLCFDGSSWRLYADPSPDDFTRMPGLCYVIDGAMDASGALWLATENGLTIKTGSVYPSLLYHNVGWWAEGVFFDTRGALWIQTSQNIIWWAVPTAVLTAENTPDVPLSFRLCQNAPNPFNASTEIGFSLAQETDVTLRVLNILGQTVDLLASQRLPSGYHLARWDGRDEAGNPVASGVYVAQLATGGVVECKKMVLLR